MSDDEYEYAYDDFGGDLYDSEEEPPDLAEQVDSLAEHTAGSPVLVNAHPDYELEWDEWEYLTDEYYDAEQKSESRKEARVKIEQSKSGKRKRGAEDQDDSTEKHKRRKANGAQEPARPSLILWRQESTSNIPLIKPGEGKEIVLLPNWRDFVPMEKEEVDQQSSDVKLETKKEHNKQHLKSKSATSSQSVGRKPGRLKTGRQKENEEEMVENIKPDSNGPASNTAKSSSKTKAKAR